jgi:thiol-disulfide isomerase/thioredoxin
MRPLRFVAILTALCPIAVTGCSTQPTTIVSGTLLDSDGSTMEEAQVHLFRPMTEKPLVTVEAGPDGVFELRTTATGALLLHFAGSYHVAHAVPLYVDSALQVEIDVRLGTPAYLDDFAEVLVVGDFNEFMPFSGVPLEPQSDGRFTAEIEADGEEVAYVLIGATESDDPYWVHGTDYSVLQYNHYMGYQSVVPTQDGKVTITFDPAQLVHGSPDPEVEFAEPHSVPASLAAIYADDVQREKDYQEAREAHLRGGGSMETLDYDWSPVITELGTRIAEEQESMLQRALWLSLMRITDKAEEVDPDLARRALESLGPAAAMWSYAPYPIVDAVVRAAGEDSGWAKRDTAYLEQVMNAHPDTAVRAHTLANAVWVADGAGDTLARRRYYGRLMMEHPESWQAEVARSYFAPDRNIMAGKPLPEFTLTALEDPSASITHEGLAGSICLIDFWATWCTPCIAEMASLHEAYDKYSDRGFEILSVALEDSREDIAEFRAEHWPMPWLHAVIGWQDAAAERFELKGIPKAILVDRDGIILRSDTDVMGEELLEVLAQIMAEGE